MLELRRDTENQRFGPCEEVAVKASSEEAEWLMQERAWIASRLLGSQYCGGELSCAVTASSRSGVSFPCFDETDSDHCGYFWMSQQF